jgi:periplasmic protein CpxP/Spy
MRGMFFHVPKEPFMHAPLSRRFHPLRSALTVLAIAVASSVAMSAWAMPGHGHGHGDRHGDGMAMHGRMLDRVNATPEQRAQITRITEAGRADMTSHHASAQALRTQMRQAMAAPVVDANTVEVLRQQGLALHDQASKRRTQMMVEISRVLSPQQRQQLAERMARRSEMQQRHSRERGQLDGLPITGGGLPALR